MFLFQNNNLCVTQEYDIIYIKKEKKENITPLLKPTYTSALYQSKYGIPNYRTLKYNIVIAHKKYNNSIKGTRH